MRSLLVMAVCVVVLTFLMCGCSRDSTDAQGKRPEEPKPTVEAAVLSRLTHGMTEREATHILQARVTHEVTARISNEVLRCLAVYRSEAYGKYYLLFRNDHLAKVCEPPPLGTKRIRYKESWLNLSVLDDPEARIADLEHMPDLTGHIPAPPSGSAVNTPPDPGLTVAFLVSRALGNSERARRQAEKYQSLLTRYDPFTIQLGEDVKAVESSLGKPALVESLGSERERRYYGSVYHGLMGERERMWVVLDYEQSKVIRIFSDDFIDFEKVRAIEAPQTQTQTP